MKKFFNFILFCNHKRIIDLQCEDLKELNNAFRLMSFLKIKHNKYFTFALITKWKVISLIFFLSALTFAQETTVIKFGIEFIDNPDYLSCYKYSPDSRERFNCINELRKLDQCDKRRFDKLYQVQRDVMILTKKQLCFLIDSINGQWNYVDSVNKHPNEDDPTYTREYELGIIDTLKFNNDSSLVYWYTQKYIILTSSDCKYDLFLYPKPLNKTLTLFKSLKSISIQETKFYIDISNGVLYTDYYSGQEAFDFSVYIMAIGEPLTITAYQFALTYNGAFRNNGNLSFKYLTGSSDLNLVPQFAVRWDTTESPRLTFASSAGFEMIPTYKKKIGRFRIYNDKPFKKTITDVNIKAHFEGNISTIITGNVFDDITDQGEYFSLNGFRNKLQKINPKRKLKVIDVQ